MDKFALLEQGAAATCSKEVASGRLADVLYLVAALSRYKFSLASMKDISRKDGVKLYLEDSSWVLLRPSGTEPLMRIYLETNIEDKQNQIISRIEQLIAPLVSTTVLNVTY